LSIRLSAGGNKHLFHKLLPPCLAFGLHICNEAQPDLELGPAAADAEAALIRTTLLPQLQLMQLALAFKAHYHNQPLDSSSRRSQQQRQPSLDHSQHKYLLAMLQEMGFSDLQVAAEPYYKGANRSQAVLKGDHSAADPVLVDFAMNFVCTCPRALQYLRERLHADSAEHLTADVAGVLVEPQLQQMSQLCQHALLMLLEAVSNMFGPEPDIAAAAATAAMYCAKLAVLRSLLGVTLRSRYDDISDNGSSSSSGSSNDSGSLDVVERAHSSILVTAVRQVGYCRLLWQSRAVVSSKRVEHC
jgi:hypothetical protein